MPTGPASGSDEQSVQETFQEVILKAWYLQLTLSISFDNMAKTYLLDSFKG